MSLTIQDRKYIDSRIAHHTGIILEEFQGRIGAMVETMDFRIEAAVQRGIQNVENRADNHERRLIVLEAKG